MTEVRDSFISSQNAPLTYRYTLPAHDMKKPRAHVVLLHGWGDHGGRYTELSHWLGIHGYAVYSPDFEGHGLSPGKRARVHDFYRLINDLDVFLKQVGLHERVVLCGHSMGGCLAFHYAARNCERVHGVIFNSAALTVNPRISKLQRLVARGLGDLAPALPVGYLKNAEMMTQLPWEQEAYVKDPLLYHGKIDAGTGKTLMLANAWVLRNMHRFSVPFLALQGSDDHLVNPQGPALLMQRANSSDKTIKVFEGVRHDLLHEKLKREVVDSMLEWLEQRFNPHCHRTFKPENR